MLNFIILFVFAHLSHLARGDSEPSPSITAPPPPALTPCVIGSSNCPSSMTCTPTSVCSDGPSSCTGACISVLQPTLSCAMTGTPTCPSPLTCTPTEPPPPSGVQSGVCITPNPPGPTSACLVSNAVTTCSHATETCSPFSASCTTLNCLGTCVTAPTPTPRSCQFDHQCGRGWRCVRKPGSHCGPSERCPGICLRY